MERTITVSLLGNRVHAEPNPQELADGDSVSWVFDQTVGRRNLQVQFGEIQIVPGPQGPFKDLLREARRIIGSGSAARIERFLYRFVEDGVQLQWDNPISGTENFGGIDVPKPPSRGTPTP